MKKFLHYLFAYIIPVILFIFVLYIMNLYPFGEKSIRITDAISQYPAFFEGLKDGDLFSFKIGMGTNFYTIFATYLASPFSLLYLFFKNYQFDLFFIIIILLKIGLIGFNMNILLNYKNNINKYSLIFSTIYALSGFVSLYYFNYQFLDALYMLPLIMIGIQKLVNDNKNIMYFITLTLMIIFHYYTAYMICIFSVIYFFFLLINSDLDRTEKKRRILKFLITSLFCGLCSSFITIPSIYSLFQGRNSYYNNLTYFGFNPNILSIFYNLTSGSSFLTDLINTSAPIFITLYIIVLVIFVFFDNKISKKYKISIGFVILLYILSLSFYLFYYAWHVFQSPVGLPGRFIFVFNCFFVLIAYKSFNNLLNIKISKKLKIIIIFSLLILIVLSFCYKLYDVKLSFSSLDINYRILIICNLFLLVYYIMFIFNKKLILLTFFLVFLELVINLICSLNLNFAYIKYDVLNVWEDKEMILSVNNFLDSLNEKKFSRVEIFGNYNSGMVYGYNGVSYYASMYNLNLNTFLENNNANYLTDVYGHSLIYNPHFLFDSLIGLKYVLNFNNIPENLEILYNNYTINSIGFLVNNNNSNKLIGSIDEIDDTYNLLTDYKYNLKLQELFFKQELENVKINDDSLFELVDSNKDGKIILEYKMDVDALIDLNFWEGFYFKNLENNFSKQSYELITLFLNEKQVSNIFEVKKGDIIRLEILLPKELVIFPKTIPSFKYIEKDKFIYLINNLNENIIDNLKFNFKGFTGDLQVSKDKNLLLITVPYDDGIEIYVNGEKKKYDKYLGGIIGLNLKEGNYKVEMKYRVKGLNVGIIISISSVFIFIILKMLEKKYINRYNYVDNKEECKK